jgi:HopA1 effector protein family
MTAAASVPRRVPLSIAADLGALAVVLDEAGPFPADAATLADQLYHLWYLNLRPPDARRGPPVPAELDLVAALEAAHAGSMRFEPGWIADRVSSTGRVEAAREGRRRLLRPGQYVDLDRPGSHPEPGDRLRVAETIATVDGGFWVARTWAWVDGSADEPPLTRLYVNVRLAGAADAVALLTEALADAAMPYALKVCLQLREAQRADSLVVYVPRDRYDAVRDVVAAPLAALADAGHLAPAVPRLTARLRAGVAAADGAGTGGSYGQERCAILARALVATTDRGAGAETVVVTCVEALEAAGLDPARPYLAPGAIHDYAPLA